VEIVRTATPARMTACVLVAMCLSMKPNAD
jgi:hypothetical protein